LEQQIHPYVRNTFSKALLGHRNELSLQKTQCEHTEPVVLVVPLLFEAGMTDLVTEIWVVRCSRQQQLERLMQRDQLTEEVAQARLQPIAD